MLITLQRLAFPKSGACECKALYYNSSVDKLFARSITFEGAQTVSFDTYFNSLSVKKWVKYADISGRIFLRLSLKGEFTLRLFSYRIEGEEVISETLCELSASHGENVFEYPLKGDETLISFSLTAIGEDCELLGGEYLGETEKGPQRVSLGVGICTFKREEYVKRNLENIKKYVFDNEASLLRENLKIFISDNAGTLELNESENVYLYKNRNLGGSGGFTRCMTEAISFNERNGEKLTHLILTDDDIKLDTEALERTYTLLSLLREEYKDAFIGGAMLSSEEENIQYSNGERWIKERYSDFVEKYNSGRDLDLITEVVKNETITDADHQAWWYCCIPMKFVRFDNLSMPFFIKCDDIEYSERNIKELIMLNGINVWHEPFEAKYSAQNEYYTMRNYLASASVHGAELCVSDIFKMLKEYTLHYVCNYKYLEAEHVLNGVNDFLKGVDFFKNTDPEQFHKEMLPKGYKLLNGEELGVLDIDGRYRLNSVLPEKKRGLKRIFALITLNGLLLPSKGYAVLGMWGGTSEQSYRKKFLIRYDVNSKKGFVLRRSFKKAVKCFILYAKTKRNVRKNYERVRSEFSVCGKELCTFEVWKKFLQV